MVTAVEDKLYEIYSEESNKTQELLQQTFSSLNNIETTEKEMKILKETLGTLYQNIP